MPKGQRKALIKKPACHPVLMAASGEEPPAEPPLGEDRAADLQGRPEGARPADLGEARPADLGEAHADKAGQGPVLPVTNAPAEVLCGECGQLVPIGMCRKFGRHGTEQFKCNPCNAMVSRLKMFLNKSGSPGVAQDLCASLVLSGVCCCWHCYYVSHGWI